MQDCYWVRRRENSSATPSLPPLRSPRARQLTPNCSNMSAIPESGVFQPPVIGLIININPCSNLKQDCLPCFSLIVTNHLEQTIQSGSIRNPVEYNCLKVQVSLYYGLWLHEEGPTFTDQITSHSSRSSVSLITAQVWVRNTKVRRGHCCVCDMGL